MLWLTTFFFFFFQAKVVVGSDFIDDVKKHRDRMTSFHFLLRFFFELQKFNNMKNT